MPPALPAFPVLLCIALLAAVILVAAPALPVSAAQSVGWPGSALPGDPAVAGSSLPSVPTSELSPTDLNGDGVYEDVNGNMRYDFADVVLYFNQMGWIAANEPIAAFDYNGNGRIDFADVVLLFGGPCVLDGDHDGTADCSDLCPTDPAKAEPGACGCGVPDTDTDGDSTPDCNETPVDCEYSWGAWSNCSAECGGGTQIRNPVITREAENGGMTCPAPEERSCNEQACPVDLCPEDPEKDAPGVCGCGHPDIDNDNDGTPSCYDQCDNNPNLINTTHCGCEIPIDTDGDGFADCEDLCPTNPNKVTPGLCGCGVPDNDTDGDGIFDCEEVCDNDSAKMYPGVCGCGVPDSTENTADPDGDTLANCTDPCPLSADNTDTDGDGVGDGCGDGCPTDPAKTTIGACGCFVTETDSDGDGKYDCEDGCPLNPFKQSFNYGECSDGTDDCNFAFTRCPGEAYAGCHRYYNNDPLHYPDPCNYSVARQGGASGAQLQAVSGAAAVRTLPSHGSAAAAWLTPFPTIAFSGWRDDARSLAEAPTACGCAGASGTCACTGTPGESGCFGACGCGSGEKNACGCASGSPAAGATGAGFEHVDGDDRGPVTVYALTTCGWCEKATALLADLGVAYDRVYVDEVDDGERSAVLSQVERYNPRGSYPTVVIGDTTIVGFREVELRAALA